MYTEKHEMQDPDAQGIQFFPSGLGSLKAAVREGGSSLNIPPQTDVRSSDTLPNLSRVGFRTPYVLRNVGVAVRRTGIKLFVSPDVLRGTWMAFFWTV
jgi:hypothetical protein